MSHKFIVTNFNEYLAEQKSNNIELDLSNYESAYNFALEYANDMFFDEDCDLDETVTDENGYTLKDLIHTYISYFKEIVDKSYIKLYRTIQKDKLKDIDYNNFGIYYSKK